MKDAEYCNKYHKLVCNVFSNECNKKCLTTTCEYCVFTKIYSMIEVLEERKNGILKDIQAKEIYLNTTSCKFVDERRNIRNAIYELQKEIEKVNKDIEFEKKLENNDKVLERQ